MTYSVPFSDSNNPAKPPVVVRDGALNDQTSVTFVGQGYTGFSPVIAGNFLHLLENFAGPPPGPRNPVEGQIWYDTTNKVVKVFDGSTWSPAGALRKSITAPENGVSGDLWVNTATSQLYVFSGSNWLLIGPQFSEGTMTGPMVEEIVDIDDITHSVLSMYANNTRMAIVSKESFIPKATTSGFATINQGINLNAVDATSSTTPSRFWGTASSADGMLVGNKVVASSNFLRGDQPSVADWSLSVRNDGGISVGSNLSFNIGVTGNTTVFSSNSSGNVDFRLSNGTGTLSTILHLGSDFRVGIGTNNTTPVSELDVAGVITSQGLSVTSATNSTITFTNGVVTAVTGSVNTMGGMSVAGASKFGGQISTYDTTIVNKLNSSGVPTGGAVMLPGYTTSSLNPPLYDIGASDKRFRNIYAESFVGNFNGTFSGQLTGSVSGSADKLSSPTTFRLSGDVTSNVITFDGQGDDPVIFNTSINQGIITSKEAATDSIATDQLLVYRSGTTLLRMSKQTFLNHVPVVPAGAIIPFAGSVVPAGYLLCDGSEVEISAYGVLFRTIGYTYKASSELAGLNTFALPDLRGRFPLGRDNMNNGITVPKKDGSGTKITTISASADRVTDSAADNVGIGSGSQSKQLVLKNIPDHKHNLNSGNAQYYAGGIPGASPDILAEAGRGLPASTTGSGIRNSGSVISSDPLGSAFDVMNPYATINYIIFTGTIL